ncbi:DNA packaging FI family protein [Escherichia coli 2-210-07_S3_C3]|nr:DNA packaging FI family protein [Escherichia coli 2-210-07_S3_C3]
MATKEENQKRLRELAGLLGREADMSGSAADIAQRVAEWEEEVCASENEIADVDDTVHEQACRQTMVSMTLVCWMMLNRSVCGNACM